ncbi:MAG: hypothetical protein WD058_06120 [Dehalococcoidia bacterium]
MTERDAIPSDQAPAPPPRLEPLDLGDAAADGVTCALDDPDCEVEPAAEGEGERHRGRRARPSTGSG